MEVQKVVQQLPPRLIDTLLAYPLIRMVDAGDGVE